jgi:hypothetical protein
LVNRGRPGRLSRTSEMSLIEKRKKEEDRKKEKTKVVLFLCDIFINTCCIISQNS